MVLRVVEKEATEHSTHADGPEKPTSESFI